MSIYILFPLLLIFHCINAEITTNSKIKENSDSNIQLVLNEWPGAGKKMARGGLIESEGVKARFVING